MTTMSQLEDFYHVNFMIIFILKIDKKKKRKWVVFYPYE